MGVSINGMAVKFAFNRNVIKKKYSSDELRKEEDFSIAELANDQSTVLNMFSDKRYPFKDSIEGDYSLYSRLLFTEEDIKHGKFGKFASVSLAGLNEQIYLICGATHIGSVFNESCKRRWFKNLPFSFHAFNLGSMMIRYDGFQYNFNTMHDGGLYGLDKVLNIATNKRSITKSFSENNNCTIGIEYTRTDGTKNTIYTNVRKDIDTTSGINISVNLGKDTKNIISNIQDLSETDRNVNIHYSFNVIGDRDENGAINRPVVDNSLASPYVGLYDDLCYDYSYYDNAVVNCKFLLKKKDGTVVRSASMNLKSYTTPHYFEKHYDGKYYIDLTKITEQFIGTYVLYGTYIPDYNDTITIELYDGIEESSQLLKKFEYKAPCSIGKYPTLAEDMVYSDTFTEDADMILAYTDDSPLVHGSYYGFHNVGGADDDEMHFCEDWLGIKKEEVQGVIKVFNRSTEDFFARSTFNNIFDYTFAGLDGTEQTYEFIADNCTDGVYLRWVRPQGGYDYYLFKEGNHTINTKRDNEYYQNIIDDEEFYDVMMPSTTEITKKMKLGACLMPDWEIDYVKNVLYSPYVWLWKDEKWVRVKVKDGDVTYGNQVLRDIEIEIEIVEPNTFIL